MPGFLDILQDPTGDSGLIFAKAMRDMGRGRGMDEAIQLGEQVAEKRRADLTDLHTRGFLSKIYAGEDPDKAAREFPAVDRAVLGGLMNHALGQREQLAQEGRQQAWWMRQQGELDRRQTEKEQRTQDETNRNASGMLSAAGMATDFGGTGTGLDPEELRIAAAGGVDGLRPVDVVNYGDAKLKQDNAQRLVAGTESANELRGVRVQGLLEKLEMEKKTRSDTVEYFNRLAAVGFDSKKVDSSGLTNIEPSMLRELIAADASAKRQDKSLNTVPAATKANIAATAEQGDKGRGAASDRANKATALKAWQTAGAPLTARDKADDARLLVLRGLVNGVMPKAQADPKSPWAAQLEQYKAELKEIAKRKAELAAWEQQGAQFEVK